MESDRAAPTVGIGMLGHGFMGRAHSHAFKTMAYMMWPPPAIPRLVAICGRNEAALEEARRRFGFNRYCTDWHELVQDPEVQAFDNLSPNNLHAEPTIEAARNRKHVLCEKPLARTGEEAKTMLDAATTSGVKHMVGFNYRFVPALRLAYDLIQAGRLGRIYHFRCTYLQSRMASPEVPMTWRLRREEAGAGAMADLGSHVIDQARWLVGEIGWVAATTRTFIAERPLSVNDPGREAVTVDDAMTCLLGFENGVMGTIEVSRLATGRKNQLRIEINGSDGAVAFDLERLNELLFFSQRDPVEEQGFRTIHVSEAPHPYYRFWWPRGHSIGWEHTFVHEAYHFLGAVTGNHEIAPYGATFLDGYRNAVVVDGIARSAETGSRVNLAYEV